MRKTNCEHYKWKEEIPFLPNLVLHPQELWAFAGRKVMTLAAMYFNIISLRCKRVNIHLRLPTKLIRTTESSFIDCLPFNGEFECATIHPKVKLKQTKGKMVSYQTSLTSRSHKQHKQNKSESKGTNQKRPKKLTELTHMTRSSFKLFCEEVPDCRTL